MTEYLCPVLGPLPCRSCAAIVVVYRVCYGDVRLPVLVVHDDAGSHRCSALPDKDGAE